MMFLVEWNEFGPGDAFPEHRVRGLTKVVAADLAEKRRERFQIMQPCHSSVCIVPAGVNYTRKCLPNGFRAGEQGD